MQALSWNVRYDADYAWSHTPHMRKHGERLEQ